MANKPKLFPDVKDARLFPSDSTGPNWGELMTSYQKTHKVDPKAAADIVNVSKKLSAPPLEVANNLDNAKEAAKEPQPGYWQWLSSNRPATAQFITDPANMAVMKDILPEADHRESFLQTVGKFMKGWAYNTTHPVKAWNNWFATPWRIGQLQTWNADIANKAADAAMRGEQYSEEFIDPNSAPLGFMGIYWGAKKKRMTAEEAYKENDAEIEKLTKQYQPAFNPFYEATKMAPMRLNGFNRGVAYGLTSVGVKSLIAKAMLGAETSGLATLATLPSDAMAFESGLSLGNAQYIYEQERGLAFKELSSMRDKNGKPFDPVKVAEFASIIGAVNAGLEQVSFEKFLGASPLGKMLGKKMGDKAITDLATKTTTKSALKQAFMAYIGAIGTEAGTEVLQNQPQRIAEVMLGAKKRPGDTPWYVEDLQTAYATAQGMLVDPMLLLGLGSNYRDMRNKVNRVQVERAAYEQLGQEAMESEHRKRSADNFENLLYQQSKGTPVENIYIDSAKIADVLREVSPEVKPEDALARLDTELGLDGALVDAFQTQSDVKIPLATWVNRVVETPLYEALKDHSKFTEDGLTFAEVVDKDRQIQKEMMEELQRQWEPIAQDAENKLVFKEIADDFYASMSSVKQLNGWTGKATQKALRNIAELNAKYVIVEAGKRGVDPRELYQSLRATYEQQTNPTNIASSSGNVPRGESNPQAATPFEEWFNGSQVVDEAGKPLQVYHGTNKPGFTEFSKNNGLQGFYFTADPNYANTFAGYSNEKQDFFPLVKEDLETGHRNTGIYPVNISLKNPLIVDGENTDIIEDIGYWSNIYNTVKENGYDGVMTKDKQQIYVFDPTQIKSVFNRGTYDKNDPNIMHQMSRDVLEFGRMNGMFTQKTEQVFTMLQKLTDFDNRVGLVVDSQVSSLEEVNVTIANEPESRRLWENVIQRASEYTGKTLVAFDSAGLVPKKTYDQLLKLRDKLKKQQVPNDFEVKLKKDIGAFSAGHARANAFEINKALANNPELRDEAQQLQKEANELLGDATFVTGEGYLVTSPIEDRLASFENGAENVYKPRYGGFVRSFAQTFMNYMPDAEFEEFRRNVTLAVEAAFAGAGEGLEGFKIVDKKLSELSESEFSVVGGGLKPAEKTIGALNLSSECPMFVIGAHGCYFDGCYVTGMGKGGNTINYYSRACYTGEILQLAQEEVDLLNSVGGLRLNGQGDLTQRQYGQLKDIVTHAKMRDLSLKVITKQDATIEMLDRMSKEGVDISGVQVQASLDSYWIPITEDDIAGSMVDAMGLVQAWERSENPEEMAQVIIDLFASQGREAKLIDGQVYRKYGYSPQKFEAMREKYSNVKIVPRVVVGTPEEIVYYIRNHPDYLQTWMHASIRGGMYSDVHGRVLEAGDIGNFTARIAIFKDDEGWHIQAQERKSKDNASDLTEKLVTQQRLLEKTKNPKTADKYRATIAELQGEIDRIRKSTPTDIGLINRDAYTKVEEYIKAQPDANHIFSKMAGTLEKEGSSFCCTAGADQNACFNCTSHSCSNGALWKSEPIDLAKAPDLIEREYHRKVNTDEVVDESRMINDVFNGTDEPNVFNQSAVAGVPETETPQFKAWFGKSQVVDESGAPLVVLHGTTHEWSTYDESRGNPINDMGIGFYGTTSEYDVSRNYAGKGPDLTSRIELEKEQLMSGFEYDDYNFEQAVKELYPEIDEDDPEFSFEQFDQETVADELAHKRLLGDGEFVMPVYLRMENPLIIEVGYNSRNTPLQKMRDMLKGTIFEASPVWDENEEEVIDEEGNAVELHDAIDRIANQYGLDGSEIWSHLLENTDLATGEATSAYTVIQELKSIPSLWDAYDDNDQPVQNQFIRDVFRDMGFDGIIYNDPGNKFTNMGIEPETKHFVVWSPNQIKSATNNNGDFSRNDDNIYRQAPVFYSKMRQFVADQKQEVFTGEQLKAMLTKGGVKADEIKWSGIMDFLDGQDKVTKLDVLKYLDTEGRVDLKVAKKGGVVEYSDEEKQALDAAFQVITNSETEIFHIIERRFGSINEDDMLIAMTDDHRFNGFMKKYMNQIPYEGDGKVDVERISQLMEDRLQAKIEQDRIVRDRARNIETKYDNYTVPGGSNYVELLVNLDPRTYKDFDSFLTSKGYASRADVPKDQMQKLTADYVNQKDPVLFKSPHWDEENNVAHIRVSERMDAVDSAFQSTLDALSEVYGNKADSADYDAIMEFDDEKLRSLFVNADPDAVEKFIAARKAFKESDPYSRVMFIEEIQSDWAQKGRKKGFRDEQKVDELTIRRGALQYKIDRILGDRIYNDLNAEDRNKVDELRNEIYSLNRELDNQGDAIQSGPFVTSTDKWVTLSLKQAIRYACEQGMDKVAFATGEQNADHYNLRKQISKISYLVNEDGTYDVLCFDNNGNKVLSRRCVEKDVVLDYFGEEMGRKILNGEGDAPYERTGNAFDKGWRDIEGADLETGGEGMKTFYNEVVPSIVSKFLKPFGIKLETIDVGHGPQIGFTISDELRNTALEQGFPMFQAEKMNAGNRGQTDFNFEVPKVTLFDGADVSTVVHENAHIWLKEKLDFLATGKADEAYLEDWDTMTDWFASKAGALRQSLEKEFDILKKAWETDILNGTRTMSESDVSRLTYIEDLLAHTTVDDIKAFAKTMQVKDQWQKEFFRYFHEEFARGFEAYLMEGKAPSSALTKVFSAFRSWLTKIYRTVRGLNVDLTEDVRKVFDRMLATEDEITELEAKARYNAGAAEAFMDNPTLTFYREIQQQAHEEAFRSLFKEQMQEIDEAHRHRIDTLRDQYADEAIAELKEQPLYKASQVIKDHFGVEAQDVAKDYLEHREWFVDQDPEILAGIADQHGFDSIDDMMQAIQASPSIGQAVEAEVSRRLEEMTPLLNDKRRMEMEALRATHNEDTMKMLVLEKQIFEELLLGQAQKKWQTKAQLRSSISEIAKLEISLAREKAREQLAKLDRAGATAAVRFFSSERKFAVEAERAIQQKDFEKALTAKRRQILNHALAIEALAIAKEVDRMDTYIEKRADRDPVKLPIPVRFQQQVDQILARVGMWGDPISVDLEHEGETLPEFVVAMQELGFTVDIDPLVETLNKSYSKLTLAEMREVYNAVKTIHGIGLKYKQFLTMFTKLSVEEVASELVGAVDALGPAGHMYEGNSGIGKDASRTKFQEFMKKVAEIPDKAMYASGLLKIEFICRYLDGGKDDGPFQKFVFGTIAQAEKDHLKRMAKAIEEWRNVLHAEHGPGEFKKWSQPEFEYTFTLADGSKRTLNKMEIFFVALNCGNEGNLDRLTKGYGLSEADIAMVTDILEKRDWDLAQRIWDYLDTYWDDIKKQENEVGNADPERVQAKPVQTKYGIYGGGYFPIEYDPDRSFEAKVNFESDTNPFISAPATRAMTKHGFTNQRAKTVGRPLNLDWSVLTNHLAAVNYDLAMRKAIIDVNRLLVHKGVKEAMTRAIGIEGYGEFNSWLKSIAKDPGEKMTFVDRIFRGLRQRATYAILGFRVLSMLKDIPTNVLASAWEMGTVPTAKMILNGITHGGEIKHFVEGKSEYMKNRAIIRDRDLYDFAKNTFEDKGPVKGVAEYYLCLQSFADELVSIPAWHEAYQIGLVKFEGDEQQAVEHADGMVRRTFASGSKKDLSRIQRGPETMKAVTMLYSWMNMMFNRYWLSGKLGAMEMERGNSSAAIAIMARATLYGLILMPLTDWAVSSIFRNGQDDDDKLKSLITQMLTFPMGTVPVVRDAWNYAVDRMLGNDFAKLRVSPIEDILVTIGDSAAGIAKAFEEEGMEIKDTEKVAKALPYIAAYPQQINTWVFNFIDWMSGEEMSLKDIVSRHRK